ncbi:hypothetical protein [Roseibium suaedae]|uniref:hypothetical protein n=1 Tax=Roseibium suaedae TaxID=735517 RepID=UPI0015881172|nr:hypothetical protein [Roseibium suaedae]
MISRPAGLAGVSKISSAAGMNSRSTLPGRLVAFAFCGLALGVPSPDFAAAPDPGVTSSTSASITSSAGILTG